MVARLVGQGSRYLLLPILPALGSGIFGETETQWHENVLDWTQETRAEAEVLSFAYHMTSGGSLFPSVAWSCLIYQVRSLSMMGMFPPAQSSLICEFGIRAAQICTCWAERRPGIWHLGSSFPGVLALELVCQVTSGNGQGWGQALVWGRY